MAKVHISCSRSLYLFLLKIEPQPELNWNFIMFVLQKKVVIRVTMNNAKCRSKALKIAVGVPGKQIIHSQTKKNSNFLLLLVFFPLCLLELVTVENNKLMINRCGIGGVRREG